MKKSAFIIILLIITFLLSSCVFPKESPYPCSSCGSKNSLIYRLKGLNGESVSYCENCYKRYQKVYNELDKLEKELNGSSSFRTIWQ